MGLRILTLSIGLVFACSAFASQAIEGFLVRKGEKFLLETSQDHKQQKLWTLNSADSSTHRDLSRLESGDYIHGSGDINDYAGEIRLESINFVGLKKLLGLWKTKDGDVFEFEDFNRLNLYRPLQRKSSAFAFRTEQLTYKVAPDTGQQWSIFVVNHQGVDMGHLSIQDDQVSIAFIDPETGAVSTTIELMPVVAWQSKLH